MEAIQNVVSSEALAKALHYVGTHLGPVLAKLSVGQKIGLTLGGAGFILVVVDTICRNGYRLSFRLGDFEFVLCKAADDFTAEEAEVIDAA